MLRMFSMSYDTAKISETIERFCNLFDGQLKYPMLESLYEYRVLICTLSAAGNLVRARFNADHFGYVFIDECASATETMALIPIAGMRCEMKTFLSEILKPFYSAQAYAHRKDRFMQTLC